MQKRLEGINEEKEKTGRDIQAGRQTLRQADRQRQAGRQTDTQTDIHRESVCVL